MKLLAVSPYIRVAMFSTITNPFVISERIIYDYEIILASGGKCKITIDGTSYICGKGDVILLRPGVPHSFECVGTNDFVQPHIHFDMFYTEKSEKTPVSFKNKNVMSDYELSLIQEDVLAEMDIPCVFTPENPQDFKRIFFEIINLYQKRPANYELLYKAKMLELISLILAQFGSAKSSTSHTPVTDIKNYIDNNYLQIITLDSLSKQFYINKFTLLRSFRLLYGQNIIAYYRGRRLEFAKQILTETDISITSVSEQMNFSDIYSFSRFFRTHAGCSPSEYRKLNRGGY